MKEVLQFLRELAANNNKPWFDANKSRYLSVKATVEAFADQLIAAVAEVEPDAALLSVKDCTYRIYRDTRFSPDKAPYKRHIGIFINPPYGKKSQLSGYYFHIEPGHCIACAGNIGLTPQMIRDIRSAIYHDVEEYIAIVESPEFKACYPHVGDNLLKTVPKGFPKDWEHIDYLRPREFVAWSDSIEEMFLSPNRVELMKPFIRQAKRYNDFVNFTIEDLI